MWYERWYDRVRATRPMKSMRSMRPMRSKRGIGGFFRNRAVRIGSAIAAGAGLMLGLRRWRATRTEAM